MQGSGSGQVSLELLGSLPNQAGCLRFSEGSGHLLPITRIQCHQKPDHTHCVWDRQTKSCRIGWGVLGGDNTQLSSTDISGKDESLWGQRKPVIFKKHSTLECLAITKKPRS